MRTLRQTIVEAMERRGWSRAELSRRSGVDEAVVNRYCNGDRDILTATADRLCRVLRIRFHQREAASTKNVT